MVNRVKGFFCRSSGMSLLLQYCSPRVSGLCAPMSILLFLPTPRGTCRAIDQMCSMHAWFVMPMIVSRDLLPSRKLQKYDFKFSFFFSLLVGGWPICTTFATSVALETFKPRWQDWICLVNHPFSLCYL